MRCCSDISLDHADVLRVMPARGIELAAFDLYKRLLSPLNQHYHKGDDAGWLATGLAGGAAGELPCLHWYQLLHDILLPCTQNSTDT